MTDYDYVREMRFHELAATVFRWLWRLGSLVGLVWLALALFSDASWFVALAICIGSQFLVRVADNYLRAAEEARREAIIAGQLTFH